MSNSISLEARRRFRLQLQSIEYADEIIDSLNEYLARFIPFSQTFSSSNWSTIYEYETNNNSYLDFSVGNRTSTFFQNE